MFNKRNSLREYYIVLIVSCELITLNTVYRDVLCNWLREILCNINILGLVDNGQCYVGHVGRYSALTSVYYF